MNWLRARSEPHAPAQTWRGRLRRKLGGPRRRASLAVLTAGIAGLLAYGAVSFADNPSGCDFAETGTTESCSGPLSGSTFAGGDGNLLTSPTKFGSTDWQNVAGLNAGFDLPSGKGDNSFGQGTKENNPEASVVTGSIPPNKSDLTRFYEASEFANSHNFLYLAWERSNVLGTANMDFEINHSATAGFTGSTTGPVTLNRTAGDLLVTFDFTNGGGRPTLALLRWVTSGPTSQCESSNSLPCWGNKKTLDGTDSIGAVNNLDEVTDPLFPNSPNHISPLPAGQFGEAAIDLTKAEVFPPGTCEAFGSTFLKSRSSASFTAEVKDLIAPVPVNISNCGKIRIIKHTVPRGVDHNFGFKTDVPSSAKFSHMPDANGTFTLNDKGNTTGDSLGNTQTIEGVTAGGPYHLTEADPTPGFDLTGLTCTSATGESTFSENLASREATVTSLAANDTVTCTYTNTQRGTIVVKKVTVPSPDPTNSEFTFNPTGFGGSSFKEKNGGSQSFVNLVPTPSGGPYSVSEEDPSLLGFDLTSSSCDNGTPANITVNPGGTTTCEFTNTLRQGAIRVTKESSKKGNPPLAGAKFVVKDVQGNVVANGNLTTGNNGTACVDHLFWAGTGTEYTVKETEAPAGYTIDNESPVKVTVNHNADCSSGSPNAPNAPAAFTDTPKTDLTITAKSEAPAPGGSKSSIQCTTGDTSTFPGTDVGNSPVGPTDPANVTANGLPPGTYTCKVVIDP
jgi:hypothetical protein